MYQKSGFSLLCFLTLFTPEISGQLTPDSRLELDDKKAIFTQGFFASRTNNSFVVHTYKFVEAVSKSDRIPEADRLALKKASKDLLSVFETMPRIREIHAFRIMKPNLQSELEKTHTKVEAARLFVAARDEYFASIGKTTTQKQLREKTWAIINSLEGKLSNFKKFKQMFLLHTLGWTKPNGFQNDPYVKELVGLTDAEIEKIEQSAVTAEKALQKQLVAIKRKTFAKIFDVLNDEQKQKLCRLCGITENALVDDETQYYVRTMVANLRGNAIDKISITFDGADDFFRQPMIANFSDSYNKANGNFSDQQLSELNQKLEKGIAGKRARFASKAAHENWVKFRMAQVDRLRQHLKNDKRTEVKLLFKNLEKLESTITKYRKGSNSLADFKYPIKPNYYIEECKSLDTTGFYGKSRRRQHRQFRLIPTTLFPIHNPFRELIGSQEKPPSDNSLYQHFAAIQKLNNQYNLNLSKAKSLELKIKVNNKFLKQLESSLLPFQFKMPFCQFYYRVGFIGFFNYSFVREDFEFSKSQLNDLRKRGRAAADQLEEEDLKARQEAWTKILETVPSYSKQLERVVGVSKKELIQFLVEHTHERLSSRKFPIYRDLESVYDLGNSFQ